MILNKDLEYKTTVLNLKVWSMSDFFIRMEITDFENFQRWSKTITKAFFERVADNSSIRDPRALYDLVIKAFSGEIKASYSIQSERDLNVDEKGYFFVLLKFDDILKLTIPFPLAENPLNPDEYVAIIKELRAQLNEHEQIYEKKLSEELRKQRQTFIKERKQMRETIQELNLLIEDREETIRRLEQEKKKKKTDPYMVSFLDRQQFLDNQLKSTRKANKSNTFASLSSSVEAPNIRKRQINTKNIPLRRRKKSPIRNSMRSTAERTPFDSMEYL